MTLAHIQRNCWITNSKRSTKAEIENCTTCVCCKAQVAQQLMGQLPEPRVTPSRPFCHNGLHDADPIQIKTTKGRGYKSNKGYVAFFVCLATKSLHLEIVSDMTSDSFLASFRRFTVHMYLDNKTTFVGAAKVFKKEVEAILKSSQVQDMATMQATQWHFNPPSGPHFGGILGKCCQIHETTLPQSSRGYYFDLRRTMHIGVAN